MAFLQFISRKISSSFPSLFTKTHSISFSSSSVLPLSEDILVSSAFSILKHHRSKSRWGHLRSLLTASKDNNLTSSQFSQIALQLRNNPRLAIRFFHFTVQHSLCSHSLLSYSTVIHILCRSRLKSQALTVIKSAFCVFTDKTHEVNTAIPIAILEALIKTYTVCDSAPFVFDLLVKACLESKKIDHAVEIHEMLRFKNVFLKTDTYNSMIELVSKSRGCSAGYDLYRKIFNLDVDTVSSKQKGVKVVSPSANTLNVVMVGFYRDGLVEKVEELWEEMESIGCVPNLYSFNVLMAAYSDYGRMDDAMRVWEEMESKGLHRDLVSYNTVISGFCGIGEVARAEEFYREMAMKGIESTCLTFEHLIRGYCEIGDVNLAMLFYDNMCRKSFCPESSTINVIIRALCDKDEVSEALEFWSLASKKHDSVMEKENYETLIRGLCQEGNMEEALELQAEMVRQGFEPNSDIYNTFIDGYVKQGNGNMACKLRKEMFNKQMS